MYFIRDSVAEKFKPYIVRVAYLCATISRVKLGEWHSWGQVNIWEWNHPVLSLLTYLTVAIIYQLDP